MIDVRTGQLWRDPHSVVWRVESPDGPDRWMLRSVSPRDYAGNRASWHAQAFETVFARLSFTVAEAQS